MSPIVRSTSSQSASRLPTVHDVLWLSHRLGRDPGSRPGMEIRRLLRSMSLRSNLSHPAFHCRWPDASLGGKKEGSDSAHLGPPVCPTNRMALWKSSTVRFFTRFEPCFIQVDLNQILQGRSCKMQATYLLQPYTRIRLRISRNTLRV